MTYYQNPDNVEQYIAMSAGYDGRILIQQLKACLPPGRCVLELGMGPGKDLDLLSKDYEAIGSDQSALFLERYRQRNPNAQLLTLNAVTLETDLRPDAIYSNKVLHQLTRDQLQASLRRQAEVLSDDGLILHSFWRGDGEDSFADMKSVYYQSETLTPLVAHYFNVLECQTYCEDEPDDSLWILARKRRKPGVESKTVEP